MKALILLLPLALIFAACGGDPDAAVRESMWEAAKESVKSQLKSPASAEFPELPAEFKVTAEDKMTMYESGDVTILLFKTNRAGSVTGWVDAKNPMGVPMRNKFRVAMMRDSESAAWETTPPDLFK